MIWLLLGAGPLLFLAAIIAASLVASLAGTPAASIPHRVTGWMPHLLFMVQVGLVGVLILTSSLWRPLVNVGVAWQGDVLLAPVVEEVLYRGYAIPALTERAGLAGAILISCIGFGLLHWPGGLWYMAATGLIAGGMLATLYVWQGTLLAPLTAHFVLNVVEFAAAWRNRAT